MKIQQLIVVRVFIVVLLVLLAAFQWFSYSDGTGSVRQINQAGLQRVRSQALAKSALLMQYDPALRITALSDMQISLPLFQQEQNALLTDQDRDIQNLLQDARPNYLAIMAAANIIIANPNGFTLPDQVSIIVAASKPYTTTINIIVFTLQRQYESRVMQLFCINLLIDMLLLFAMIAYNWLHSGRRFDVAAKTTTAK